MHSEIVSLFVCPECRTEITLNADATRDGDQVESGSLVCRSGHVFPIVGRVPRFVQHELDADQARTRDSFGYEWTKLYPEHGHSTPE